MVGFKIINLNSKYVIMLILAGLVVGVYFCGKHSANKECAYNQLQRDRAALADARAQEQAYNVRAVAITTKLLREAAQDKELLQHELDNLKADKLANTIRHKCPSAERVQHNAAGSSGTVPATTDTSGVICYRDAELLKQIKASMAIGAECDRLAKRYNALLEVCRQ